MKFKKRKKTSRLRGSRTAGWGFRQKHKGHGNKGGRGMSGSGKRADQKKQKVLMMAKKKGFKNYFGGKGFTSRSNSKKKIKVLNVGDIEKNFEAGEINLQSYKILGGGEVTKKFVVRCKEVSKAAREKIEKAGGKVVLVGGGEGSEVGAGFSEKKKEIKESELNK